MSNLLDNFVDIVSVMAAENISVVVKNMSASWGIQAAKTVVLQDINFSVSKV